MIKVFNILCNIILVASLAALSGCASATDAAETAVGSGVGAAAGGGIGYVASHGNWMTTAISGLGGAAGGGLLTSLFQSRAKNKKQTDQQKGYDLGKSDEAKSLYWVARSLQKPNNEPNDLKDKFLQATEEQEPTAEINQVSYAVTLPVSYAQQ